MQAIRLEPYEILIIKKAFQTYFPSSDHLWVFGSRVHLDQKGGDIDLYIETQHKEATKIIEAKLDFLVELKKELGDQKIDVVIKMADHTDVPIYLIAKSEGVQLV